MKKTQVKKLGLTKETVRKLQSSEIERVAGGAVPWWDFGTWSACTTNRETIDPSTT
jgi:hypothetical protein